MDLMTGEELKYHYHKFKNDIVVFKVMASQDALVILSGRKNETQSVIEVIIGGYENTKSIIRYNRTDVAVSLTPNILSSQEFRNFWIRSSENAVTVGKGDAEDLRKGSETKLLTWTYPELFKIKYYGFSTGLGVTGEWFVDTSYGEHRNDMKSEAEDDHDQSIVKLPEREPKIEARSIADTKENTHQKDADQNEMGKEHTIATDDSEENPVSKDTDQSGIKDEDTKLKKRAKDVIRIQISLEPGPQQNPPYYFPKFY